MKTVLCFGDSNTWGYDAKATLEAGYIVRHPAHVRWTGILSQRLGEGYRVVEEGQNGRTTVWEDPHAVAPRNGRAVLPILLESQKPIDLVIMMLGTNDLKTHYHCPVADIGNAIALLSKMILRSDAGLANGAPQLLIVSPPAVGDLSQMPELASRLEQGREKSLALPAQYAAHAKLLGVPFFNAQTVTEPCKEDGLHLDADSHLRLGTALAEVVKGLLS
jgi:lysophospholipase L1-like esterase